MMMLNPSLTTAKSQADPRQAILVDFVDTHRPTAIDKNSIDPTSIGWDVIAIAGPLWRQSHNPHLIANTQLGIFLFFQL
jgi:hypothetical protein